MSQVWVSTLVKQVALFSMTSSWQRITSLILNGNGTCMWFGGSPGSLAPAWWTNSSHGQWDLCRSILFINYDFSWIGWPFLQWLSLQSFFPICYYNIVYTGLPLRATWKLQLVQYVAEWISLGIPHLPMKHLCSANSTVYRWTSRRISRFFWSPIKPLKRLNMPLGPGYLWDPFFPVGSTKSAKYARIGTLQSPFQV